MAEDHFQKHYYQKDHVDWNFNILVGAQPDVARMAQEYVPILSTQEGLYDPIPARWLHATILRVGFTSDYTEEEMRDVANVLAPKLARLQLPELMLGNLRQWSGNIVFDILPTDAVNEVYNAVVAALSEVVGETRATTAPHGRFIPHITLAYTKDRQDEAQTAKVLDETKIEPVRFHAHSLALIRQWPTGGHYEWEVVHEIPIGAGH